MNKVALLSFFVMWSSTSFLAQTDHHSDAAKILQRYSLVTIVKYCDAVETFSNNQQPRVFAQKSSVLGPSSGWVEFSSRDAWEQAGKPQPLALVWYKDDRVARVAITPPDSRRDGSSYTDYCYRPDGSLARLRSVPDLQTECDQSDFHCSLTFRGERFYHPKPDFVRPSAESPEGKTSIAAPPVDVLALDGFDRRLLKSERTSFTVAPPDWPEYLSVQDLPFKGLLYASTK